MTRALKQEKYSKNCVAVVAAMACGCLPEDFEIKIGHKPPYNDIEFIYFLGELNYGFLMGFKDIQEFDPKKQTLRMVVDLEDWAAYIIVKSEINNAMPHAIYWDGKQIYDPNPLVENGRPFSDYKILTITPFTKEPIDE